MIKGFVTHFIALHRLNMNICKLTVLLVFVMQAYDAEQVAAIMPENGMTDLKIVCHHKQWIQRHLVFRSPRYISLPSNACTK